MEDSLFTKIIQRKIPAEVVAENDHVIVIKDIAPQTPIHFLIIPKKPFENIQNAQPEDREFFTHVFEMARHLSQTIPGAKEFKLLMNNGYASGQRVFHAHVHFMAGF